VCGRASLTSALEGVTCLTPRPHYYSQGKSPRYALHRRLGGPQSRSGRGEEEKNFRPPARIEPPNHHRPAHSLALYRLSSHGSCIAFRRYLIFKYRTCFYEGLVYLFCVLTFLLTKVLMLMFVLWRKPWTVGVMYIRNSVFKR
jgi:hypothetical protein